MTHTSPWNKSLVVVVICELEQRQPHKLMRAVTSLWTMSYFPMKFSENVKFNVAGNLRRLCKCLEEAWPVGVCVSCVLTYKLLQWRTLEAESPPWQDIRGQDNSSFIFHSYIRVACLCHHLKTRVIVFFFVCLFVCFFQIAERPELGASLQTFMYVKSPRVPLWRGEGRMLVSVRWLAVLAVSRPVAIKPLAVLPVRQSEAAERSLTRSGSRWTHCALSLRETHQRKLPI